MQGSLIGVCSLVLVGVVGVVGCSPVVKTQGRQGVVEATYARRTLSATLPASARVPAVIAAAEETVRARGYSVERSTSTEEVGVLVARPPRTTDFPVITIDADVVPNATRVRMTVSPFGDQEMSRSILDGTLQRLGL